MRRTVPLLMAAVLACFVSLGVSGTARAECPYFVIPPAPEAARSAREVIVGTVIENVGGHLYDFRLRIDRVLRGPARIGDIRRIEFLYPGWPFNRDGNGNVILYEGKPLAPCEAIPGWKGNVIALSLDAVAPDGTTRYNAASWISGDLPINRELPRTTLGEMVSQSGLPQTDASPSPGSVGDRRAPPPVTAIVVAIAAILAVAALNKRQRFGR